MKEDVACGLLLLFVILGAVLLGAWVVVDQNTRQDACERSGGVFLQTDDGALCLKKECVKQ